MSNSTIQVNQSNVSGQSNAVNNAASYLTMKDLSNKDEKTTIYANGNSKQSYLEGELLLQSLGEELDKEAGVISDLGVDFADYDKMLEGFWNLGER